MKEPRSVTSRDDVARLVLRGVCKAHPSIVANDGIDLAVRAGEIHAVLGENGAAKCTLMKIVYGVAKPNAGEILWEGKPVAVTSPAHARPLSIGMVFQNFSVFDTRNRAHHASQA